MLDQITPLILTRNEAANISRTLERLRWARDIVIVDSNSDDDTATLAGSFPQVRFLRRSFDTHARQWNFALHETGIHTEWVLALDADYVLSDELVQELAMLRPDASVDGYRASFRYVVYGRALRGSAYPPATVLFRRRRARYVQDGHTQRVVVDGAVNRLRGMVFHDDRKPLDRWFDAQRRYTQLEADKLVSNPWRCLGWADRLRRLKIFAPIVMPFYCLFWKRAIFHGRAGLLYTMQRTLAELLLAMRLIDIEQTPSRKVSRAEAPAHGDQVATHS